MPKIEDKGYRLYHGDCLEILPKLSRQSVDLVLTDPPYGATDVGWDKQIPFKPMWGAIERVATPNAAIILMASQPFTSWLGQGWTLPISLYLDMV